jgi:hypothetical protein
MVVAQAAAIANNGHTNASAFGRARRLGRAPLRFYWFDDGLYVVRAVGPEAGLVGGRIRAIDGHPPEELWRVLRKYVGGNDGRFLELAPYLHPGRARNLLGGHRHGGASQVLRRVALAADRRADGGPVALLG